MADLITRTDPDGREWTFDSEFRTWRVPELGLLVICGGHRLGGRTERWQTSNGSIYRDVDDAMAREVAGHEARKAMLDTVQANHDQILTLAREVHQEEVAFWKKAAMVGLLLALASSALGLLAVMW